jgi:hypothetical protein
MQNIRKMLICFFLVVALPLPCYAHIVYAQDTVISNTNESETIVASDGYDPLKLQPTKYPDVELADQDILKIWGGPYLFTNDQICFALFNNTEKEIGVPMDYVLEAEINDQWYQIYEYIYGLAGPAIWMGPGDNYLYAVATRNRPKLYPGKHRIVLNNMYVEFEIVEQGSDLPKKPQNYDWQLLWFKTGVYGDGIVNIVERYGIDIIKIERQPITTSNKYIFFSIDIETKDGAYWGDLYLETKLNNSWQSLTMYHNYSASYDNDLYTATAFYRAENWDYTVRAELTLDKVMLTEVWEPAGLFAGTHRL